MKVVCSSVVLVVVLSLPKEINGGIACFVSNFFECSCFALLANYVSFVLLMLF